MSWTFSLRNISHLVFSVLTSRHRSPHPQQAKHLKAKKEEGNLAFKKGSLAEALKLYSEALEIDPLNKATNAKLYFNRATVQARLNNNQEAIGDCSQVGGKAGRVAWPVHDWDVRSGYQAGEGHDGL